MNEHKKLIGKMITFKMFPELQGMITAICVRDESTTFEVSYFQDHGYNQSWHIIDELLFDKEVAFSLDKIGFKQE